MASAATTQTAGPSGLLRWAFRLPVHLYQAGLGWMLGTRFVMLTHLGRRSGLVRRTVLEVVRFEPATRTATVVAAWGERADWFRNVSAHPPLEVWIGRDRFVPELEVLDLEQTRALLEEYQREHPRLARRLFRLTGVEVIDADSAADVASVVRAVRLRPGAPPAAT